FPPIGAQGFNLGIRDVELIAEMARGMEAPRLSSLGPRYNLRRFADVTSRTASVDILNRSLLSGFLPVQLARIAGMHAINMVGPLRRLLMREGVSPGGQIRSFASRFRQTG
ncbi:MAG TPA: UbiH/UbiF family hydroxylase, partial [Rhizobiaceae bacterium]|nr:UbiH/UbiF family hydroxylase [Rhizobiaceae bacterium]